jgi:prevent-host-death family protein
MTRVIPAHEFEAKCLEFLSELEETREPIIVTKDGKPLVRVVSVDEPERR